ncbi:unnamed protein product [Penicillium nalgiovense]|nr:unnamed protein product [Penicillium nalgiovense]
MRLHFPNCKPLPGAEKLLSNLSRARSASSGNRIELALASSSKSHSYELKTSGRETKRLLSFFQSERRVLGDDPRVRQGRGKPAPDIYLVAHPDVAIEYQARQKDVLAGRTGITEVGDDWQLGEIDDGWAEAIPNLEHFNYQKYGIVVPS